MGNNIYCCKKNYSTDESNLIKLSVQPKKHEEMNKNKNIKATNSSLKNQRLNTSFTFTEPKTSHNSSKNLNIKKNGQNNNMNNIIRSKIRSQTVGRRSAYLNRTFINIILIGDKKVGKTCLIEMIDQNIFNANYNESKEDENIIIKLPFNNKTYNLNFCIPIVLHINNILSIPKDYIIMMYDINNNESVTFIKQILDNIKNKIKYNHLITNIILLGNKKDIKENNSEAIQLSKEFNISHFEISIKKNIGIDEFTNKITKDFDYVETIMDKE